MSNTFVHKTLFHMADHLRGDGSLSKLKSLKESQYWNDEMLKTWQLDKVNSLLIHAKKESPFYKKRLEKVILPLKGLKELEKIPILTKKDIRENIEIIKCSHAAPDRLVASNTGGSTGEPMQYFCDRIALGWRRAAVLRSGEWAGISLGEKNIQMTGSHYEYTKRKKIISRLKSFLFNSKNMSVAYINDDTLDDYYREMIRWQPESIWGYASALYNFAIFIENKYPGSNLDFIKSVITSSETLQPYQRESINGIFGGTKVFDHYGSSEFYIAAECSYHNGYHINEDILKLETVDDEGRNRKPGEVGRIVLTDLYNLAFPFIRYDIGDIGALSEKRGCACDIQLPKLEKLEGRIGDMVTLSDRMLTTPNFNNIFRTLKGVNEYQIIQQSTSNITVNIVKNIYFDEASERYICYSLERLLGKTNKFALCYVDSIDVPKSGKRRYVISEVAKITL